MRNDRLLLFTRYPTPGFTKTRMIPRLGPEGAADLQEWLTGHSVIAGSTWAAGSGGQVDIHVTGAAESSFQCWLGRGHRYIPQHEGGLGERLLSAAQSTFDSGAERICLIGIDCPALGPEHIQQAFDALEDHDVSLIPATDGGYVLIGMKAPQSELFRDMPWGTETVCRTTHDRALALGLQVWTGDPLQDMDVPEDLDQLTKWKREATGLSVIIPSYNEEARISFAVESALEGAAEVLVVDGGSQDETVKRAQAAGARVVTGVKGRGPQQNLGAWHAIGDTLLFLHADSRLPDGYAEEVDRILSRQGVGLGAFSLAIDGDRSAYRWVERGANLRSRIRSRPYGDQSLFLRRDLFERVGGFPPFPLLEDLEFVRQVSKRRTIAISPLANLCSARRWESNGVFATTLRNQKILLAYQFGVSPEKLAAGYYGAASRTKKS